MSAVAQPLVRRRAHVLKRAAAHADPATMRRRRMDVTEQDGMTLVELMVAAFVLVVGMLAIATMLTTAFTKNNLNSQRVAATNLARELTEAARIAAYDSLTAAGVAEAVQDANENLASDATPWQVERRNTVFTITATSCTYDDPADTYAEPAPAERCALAAGTAASPANDLNGDDFRRVSFVVSWRAGGDTESVTQTALIVNPAGGLGPRIVPPFPVVSPVTGSQSTVSFTVNTTSAASLHFNVDDGLTAGDGSGGPKAWTVTWDLSSATSSSAVLDGTYTIGLQPFSDRGIPGDSRAVDVTVNRSAPFAPTGFAGGYNTREGALVDFEWSLNAERDIIGYRVYDGGPDKAFGTSDDRLACPGTAGAWLENTAVSCQDMAPHGDSATYYLVALDLDPAGTPRQGAVTKLDVAAPGNRPAVPENVVLTTGPTISWTAPSSGSVAFYRVYRDGTTPEDRIGRLPASPYTDDGAGLDASHDYYLSAVDDKYNESDLVGPLPWSTP